jgi:aerobic C4-dicarboxylate transport protein
MGKLSIPPAEAGAGDGTPNAAPKKRDTLYLQVLAAIALGVLFGALRPDWAVMVKPLGDAFVKLIKMLIAPIVFSTIVVGIANLGDLRKVGRVGLRALLYFEAMSTLALLIGLVVVHAVRPGVGLHVDPHSLDGGALSAITAGKTKGFVDHLLAVIPENFVGAFVHGEILQVLFVAVLVGVAVAAMGERRAPLVQLVDDVGHLFFRIVGLVMRVAPLGAFGAMAYTVGKYGIGTLGNLAKLMVCFYTTALLFVFVVLGLVCRLVGANIFRLVRYLREELLIVLGTSSSESALPTLMEKLERLGCAPAVVRLVVPTGYSFNLDGTSIYLTMAALFVAQALDVPLTLRDEITLLIVLLLTSKGAAAVTGGGFVTLAATLSSTGTIPVAGLTMLLGIDRFMSEARALVNLLGNAVATLVVARWERSLDDDKMRVGLWPERPPTVASGD